MSDPVDDLGPVSGGDEQPTDMTPKLLARLFVVPLLIVVMIVGCSLAVFLLFGWISEGREQSIEKLVARIEAGSGEKLLDVAMLPKDREVWQAAVDLARRLQSEEGEKMAPEERARFAARLGSVLEKSLKTRQSDMGREMQQYLLMTLGRLDSAEHVPLLVAIANDQSQPVGVRRDAVGALVVMKNVPAARRSWPEVAVLIDSPEPVLRIVATAAVGALAEPGDEMAIKVLRRAYSGEDREVQWNAALALARQRDFAAVPLLKDMLTRAYWESVAVSPEPGDSTDSRRRLTPVQVERYLAVSIDAAGGLGSPELLQQIEALKRDPSPQVRDCAAKALIDRPAVQTRPGAASAPSTPLGRRGLCVPAERLAFHRRGGGVPFGSRGMTL